LASFQNIGNFSKFSEGDVDETGEYYITPTYISGVTSGKGYGKITSGEMELAKWKSYGIGINVNKEITLFYGSVTYSLSENVRLVGFYKYEVRENKYISAYVYEWKEAEKSHAPKDELHTKKKRNPILFALHLFFATY
jgi:hypothetical protein